MCWTLAVQTSDKFSQLCSHNRTVSCNWLVCYSIYEYCRAWAFLETPYLESLSLLRQKRRNKNTRIPDQGPISRELNTLRYGIYLELHTRVVIMDPYLVYTTWYIYSTWYMVYKLLEVEGSCNEAISVIVNHS